MAPVLTLLLAAAAAAGTRFDTEIGVRADARTRTALRGSISGSGVTLLEAVPLVALLVDSGALHLRSEYAPTIRDVDTRAEPAVLHVARLRLESRPRGQWRLGASVEGTYGTSDPVADLRMLHDGLAAIPAESSLDTASLRLEFDLQRTLRRRTLMSGRAGFIWSGGLDDLSRTALPVQGTATLGGSLSHAWTRRTSGTLSIDLSATRTDPGQRVAWAGLSANVRRFLSRNVEAWVAGGVASSYEETPGENGDIAAFPSAEVGIAHSNARLRVGERAVARIALGVNRLTGALEQRSEFSGEVTWKALRTVSVAISGAVAVPRERREGVLALGAVRAVWAPRARLAIHAGGTMNSQSGGAGIPEFLEAGVFAGLAWTHGSR